MEYWVELRGPALQIFQYSNLGRRVLVHMIFGRGCAGFFVAQQFYLL